MDSSAYSLHIHAVSDGTLSLRLLKGILHPKIKKLLQTYVSFFLLLNTKEDILKNDWNQTVVGHH